MDNSPYWSPDSMPVNLFVLDDDPAVTELLSILLGNQGFEVMTSNSGLEGVRLIRETGPELVILDLMMPGMDGWEVCAEIRSFSNVPILILSALNDPGMIASILDRGADDFLTKPILSGVLVAHINRLVKRTAPIVPVPVPVPVPRTNVQAPGDTQQLPR